ncbi:MAG: hypothetical protein ACRCVS_01845 [Fusobacteriaceae bacterium]
MKINYETLSPKCKDIDKAITSLMEELEAVNFYNMRAEQTADPELRGLLIHNRNEEIEHAAMLTEWLRRNMPNFDKELKDYLFTKDSLTKVESVNMNRNTADKK